METIPPPGPTATRTCPYDPPDAYRTLQERQVVGTFTFPDAVRGHVLTTYRQATEALVDARFSSAFNEAPTRADGSPVPGWFFGMDLPEQGRYRRLLTPHLTMRASRQLTDRIATVVDNALTAVTNQGPPTDLFGGFAWPVPGLVICDLLGLSAEDIATTEAAVAIFDSDEASRDERVAAFWRLWDTVLRLAHDKKVRPDDSVMSRLVNQHAGPDGLTPEECASAGIALRLAGQAPVSHVIGFGLYVLLSEPSRWRSLQDDPDRIGRTVDELLRYVPSNNLGVIREATEDIDVDGTTIRAGEFVVVPIPTVNRDAYRFSEPNLFDPDRPMVPHLAFGHGAHKCLGQNLARVELETVLRLLIERIPTLRLDVRPSQVPLFESESSYGVAALPVTW